MLKFNTQQQIAENTIIDQIILATASGDQTISVNQFKGAVVVDPNLGNYVVIDFTVTDTSAMNIGRIRLMHGQTPVAISEDDRLLIVKEANKNLKIRLAAQFAGAENCKFNTTSVNLPYATPFREGVVRFANVTTNYGDTGWNITDNEENKSGTVYSADVVDKKINQVTSSLGNLDQYAKKAESNEFTGDNNTFANKIFVNGEIGGTAVTDAGENGDKQIVNVGYADNKYLTKDTASSTYLSKNEAGTTYLTKNDASSTYLTQENAANTYLTKEAAEQAAGNYAKLNVDNDFAANTTNTFNGDVTVKGTFVVGNSQETATFAVTGDGIISGAAIQIDKVADPNSNRLPTEGAVKSALNDVESALTEKDTDLQSQIDGINAGQNLADIVNDTSDLAAYDISHLKAKDDQHGAEGATWAIGDKVQVLGGDEVQSSVYELIKGTKPEGEGSKDIQSTNNTNYYWRYIGVYGTNAYTKSEIDTKVNTINTTLGTKADKSYVDDELAKKANSADVYSKTEADGKFAQLVADNTFTGNNTFNGTIIGDAVTSDIATDAENQGVKLTTSTGVSNFVTKVVNDKITELQGGMSYLKLSSETVQTVESSVAFNGIISGTAVAEGKQQSADGSKLVTVAYANEKFAQLAAENTFTGATNTFQAITATTVSAQTFTGNGVSSNISEDAPNNGTKLPTCTAVVTFVDNAIKANQNATSNKNKVGAMGLFLYTGGDSQEMGAEVAGTSLQAVGMQLPMDGVVSWSQGAVMEGTWKLLNNTIAGEPCLVLAIRVG